jgi:hypothetical protein
MQAIIQFSVSDEFKDMLFEQYKVANCGEIADVMTGEILLMFKFNNGTLSLIFVYFPTFSSTAFFPVFFSLNVNLTKKGG